MKKRLLSLLISMLMAVNCLLPVTAFASDTNKGTIEVKYYDVMNCRYIESGENLKVDGLYDVEIYAKNMEHLGGATVPLHFNKNAIKVASYTDNQPFPDRDLKAEQNNIQNYFKIEDSDLDMSVLYAGIAPCVSNAKGLVILNFIFNSPADIIEEAKLFSFRIKALATGKIDLCAATEEKHGINGCYDLAPLGPEFTKYGTADTLVPYDFISEDKYVVYGVTGVELDVEKVEILVESSVKINATVYPQNAENKNVIWSSENEKIAIVDTNGRVTGISVGETVVNVTTVDGSFIDSCVVKVLDINTPTKPQNLTVVSQTGKSVEFKWTESTGKSGISGYNIYRNGELIGTTDADTCIYEDADSKLVTGKEYSYTVEAFYNDIKSVPSDELKVILSGPEIVKVTPETQSVFGSSNATEVTVYFKNYTEIQTASVKMEYSSDRKVWNELYSGNADTVSFGKDSTSGLNYFSFEPSFNGLNGEYYFKYTITDKESFKGEYEVVYTVVAPPEISNFILNDLYTPGHAVEFKWDVSSEYIKSYHFVINDTISYTVDTKDGVYTSWTVEMESAGDYTCSISAVDSFGQVSNVLTEEVTVQPFYYPPEGGIYYPENGAVISGTQKIRYNVIYGEAVFSYSTDGGATWIEFARDDRSSYNDVNQDPLKGECSLDTMALAGTILVRMEILGHTNTIAQIYSYTVDNQGPAKVTGLSGTAASVSVTLNWQPVPDKDLYYYAIEEKTANGTYVVRGERIYDFCTKTITGLIPGNEYTYRVVAYDLIGNRGIPSDDFTISTLPDDVAPVVVKISPNTKKINENTEIIFNIQDNYAVDGAKIQVSTDNKSWNTVSTVLATEKVKSVALSYTLVVSSYDDGDIYVRAIPFDTDNNSAAESSVPSMRYVIDTTAPAKVQIDAQVSPENIKLVWNKPASDVSYYVIERKYEDIFGDFSTEYVVIADNYTETEYIDKNTDAAYVYTYRIKAVDDAGNIGEWATVSDLQLEPDEIIPVITAMIPDDGNYISRKSSIVVNAEDNVGISEIELFYRIKGTNNKRSLGIIENKNAAKFDLGILLNKNLEEREYIFTAVARDTTWNESKPYEVTYKVDNTAPVLDITKVTPGVQKADVEWKGESDDIISFKVEYAEKGSSVYKNAGNVGPNETGNYTKTISGLNASKTYIIRITATDKAGNTAYTTSGEFKVEAPSTPEIIVMPEVRIVASSTAETGVPHKFTAKKVRGTYPIASYSWDFGDASTAITEAPVHTYTVAREYKVTLNVTDTQGNTASASMTVNAIEVKDTATLTVNVTDENGNKISSSSVIFDGVTYRTDSSGKISIKAEPGTHSYIVYANGYISVQKTTELTKGIEKTVSVKLIKKNVLISKVKWNRMTASELKAVGINTGSSAAAHYYKYEITLALKGTNGRTSNVVVNGFKYYYDDSPIVISGDILEGKNINGNGKFTNNTMYIYDFTPEDKIDGFVYDNAATGAGESTPYAIVTWIEIPKEAYWVGEEFDIMTTVFNQASLDYNVSDCYAELKYPDFDMSISKTIAEDSEGEAAVVFGEIGGQKSKSVTWVMNGDRSGKHYVDIEFHGILNNDKSIDISYRNSENPIIIYGNESLSRVVQFEDEIRPYDDYMIRVGLKNKSIVTKKGESAELFVGNYLVDSSSTGESYTVEIEAVPDYFNYVESPLGERRMYDDEGFYFNETLYSNYIIRNLKSVDDVEKIVNQATSGSLASGTRTYTKVKSHSFHERDINIYRSNKKTNILNVNAGEEIVLIAEVTENYPSGTRGYAPDGTEIYIDNIDTHKKIENGQAVFTYTVPEDAEGSLKLTFKGNRTKETGITLNILPKATLIDGVVHDKYGNPLKNVEVSVYVNGVKFEETETDKTGNFQFTKAITPQKVTIELVKDKYKTITEEVDLLPGKTSLSFSMERQKAKPKVNHVTPTYLGKRNKDIIIPAGLQTQEFFTVKASTNEGTVDNYRLVKTSENGQETILNESDSGIVFLDTAELEAGDTLSVVVCCGDVESAPYELPVRVIEAPFVHLLNNMEFETEDGEMNAALEFGDLLSRIRDKNGNKDYWLSDDAWDEWETLIDSFATKGNQSLEIPESGDAEYNVQDTNTSLNFDWLSEDFEIYITYDFQSGELHISQLNDNYYKNNKSSGVETGKMWMQEKIDTNASFHYGYLKAYEKMSWPIESDINIYFELNDDEDGWNGEFELISDADNEFSGTYYRKLKAEKDLVPFDIPDYLEGKFNKNVMVSTDVTVPLSDVTSAYENGQGGLAFPVEYTSYTSGSWDNGVGKIMLSTQSENTLYPLYDWTGTGSTVTYGNYYLFGYNYPFYTYDNTYREYDTTPSSASLFGMINPEEEMKFEPISFYAASESIDAGVVKDGIFANTEISVTDGETPMLVYIDSDKTRTEANQATLVSSLYDAQTGTWSTPVTVDNINDNTGDYNPEIANTDNGFVAVWANSAEVPSGNSFFGLSQEEIASSIASKIGISAAIYKDGSWENSEKINKSAESSATLNHSPAVAAYEDKTVAVWINNQQNNMTGYDRTDVLRYAVYDGYEWSEDKLVSADNVFDYGAIADVKITESNGTLFMLFASEQEDVHESEPDAVTGEKTEVTEVLKKYYLMTYNGEEWSAVKALNHDVYSDAFADFVVVDGKLQIVTISNMTIHTYDALTREILHEEILNAELNSATGFDVSVSGNNVIMTWINCGNDGQIIYSALYDNDLKAWGDPVEITSTGSEYIIRNINTIYKDSKLVVVYNKHQYDATTGELINVSLCSEAKEMGCDLQLNSVVLNDAVVISGIEAHFTAEVTNNGLNPVSGFTISYRDAEGIISGTHIVESTLAGGATEKYDFKCIAGEIVENIVVNAKLEIEGDTDNNNNSASCDIVVENTEITDMEIAQTSDDDLVVTVNIKNSGTVPVSRKINLTYDGETFTNTSEIIAVGESKAVLFKLNDAMNKGDITAEIDLNDNAEMFANNKSVTEKYIPVGISFKGVVAPYVKNKPLDNTFALNSFLEASLVVKIDDEVEIEKALVSDDNVSLTSGDASKDFEVMVPIDEEEYTFELIAPGLLTRTIVPSKMNNSDIKLIAGDLAIDSSNSINARDLGVVIQMLGVLDTDAEYQKYMDFDNDGQIEGLELDTVVSNYSASDLYYILMDEGEME